MVEKARCPVQRDTVYRWFSELSSWQRIEFLCGLLDLCLPLELRFLGSCLEDLARKDYHSLRDSEIKANNSADLAALTNLGDEVVRSKLLVSLALLTSENREAAGVLCRTLTHMDSIINNLGLQLNDGRTGDEFLLLFTMATNHPAFSFHQKQLLRKELAHLQGRHGATGHSVPTPTTITVTSSKGSSTFPKLAPRTENLASSIGNSLANALHTSAHSIEDSLPMRPSGKHSKVNVEKIEIKVLPHKKKEKNADCCFEVFWSDSSVSLVTKSSTEISELISKLSHLYSDDLEKCIPYRGSVDSYSMDRNHMDLDLDLQYLVCLPPHVLKSDLIKKFFSSLPSHQPHQSLSSSNPTHVKVNTAVGPTIREKSEKRFLNPAQCSFTSSGVARVPPTSHVGPMQSIHYNHSTELSVDVEPTTSQMPQEGSSSSEYSSSPSSPMGLQTREESSDSAEEMDRRLGRHLDCTEKEKSVLLVNHFTSTSVRPTAQVLPVQNDAGSSAANHHTLPIQIITGTPTHFAPLHLINTLHKSDRGGTEIKLLQSPHSLLSSEERSKLAAPRSSIKIEKSFGGMLLDVKAPSNPLQSGHVLSIMPDSSSMAQTMAFGVRTKVGSSMPGERTMKPTSVLVDSSMPVAPSSAPVFHVARTPVKLLVSSADSSMVGQMSCSSVSPAIISPRNVLYTANTKVAFSTMSGAPVAQMSGNYCANSNASSSSLTSTSYSSIANLPSCSVPSSNPTSVSDNSYYSGGGNSPTMNLQVASQTSGHHHLHHQPQQSQTGCTVCSSCGCSGSCGSSGVAVNYGNYFQHFSAPSMFPFSIMPFNPMCNNGYINTQQYNNSSSFPVMHNPYSNSLNPDSMLTGQPSFSIPPMQNFITGTAGVYQPQGIMGAINGTLHKKSSNVSCYNCGVSGHRAQDCKQPSMDFNQQGTFHLKYAPPSDGLDSAD
ncbi:zinc finger CCHC domain-containing protein 14 isoform X2 [Rana temporaria]|uniref:zinc finger CCHC domain-containing protein 14 isoform X2 n=1 Tax=Rana temporaria TaxID=8407 RepID=UPI001AAC52A2|nr:zinc finger CCHC domain-containing protein 14 isoform X2 [Rana temporaria]